MSNRDTGVEDGAGMDVLQFGAVLIAEQLAVLESLSSQELRLVWRKLYRAAPPMRMGRDLLRLGVGWKLQAHVARQKADKPLIEAGPGSTQALQRQAPRYTAGLDETAGCAKGRMVVEDSSSGCARRSPSHLKDGMERSEQVAAHTQDGMAVLPRLSMLETKLEIMAERGLAPCVGLSPAVHRRLLAIAADKLNPSMGAHKSLKPGTVLLREWRGHTHKVLVLDGGFEWRGKRWTSLSAIARAITGVAWSGPRFFGVKAKSTRFKSKEQGHEWDAM